MKILGFLLLLFRIKFAVCFLVDPVNQTVPVNTTASFLCTPSENGDPDNVVWSIYFPDKNKFYLDSDPVHTGILTERGYRFESDNSSSFMSVTAFVINNRTRCACRLFIIGEGSVFSEEAYLTIQGPPLPPGVSATYPSPLEILLTWGEPFTWPAFPILNYTIVETDVVTRDSKTLVTHFQNYSHTATRIATQCMELRFTVTATSALGDSNSTIITTGLPIAPGNSFENFDTLVRFRSNGDPEVTITLKPPPVCSFQEAQLILEVLQVDSNESMLQVSRNYSGAQPTFTFHITKNLLPNTNYTLIAIVTTIAGNATEEWTFDTVLVPPSSTDMDTSLKLGLLGAIIGGVAGGVVLLVFMALIVAVCICLVVNYRATKALRASAGTMGTQECMYESIDDMQIMHSTTQKNQYQEHFPIRPESPYQPMKSAELDPNFSGLHDPLASSHYTSPPCPPMPLQTDHSPNDFLGEMCLSNGSRPAATEDAYIAMTGTSQRLSAVSDSNRGSGEYRLSIC